MPKVNAPAVVLASPAIRADQNGAAFACALSQVTRAKAKTFTHYAQHS
jgi:hypothetical protein